MASCRRRSGETAAHVDGPATWSTGITDRQARRIKTGKVGEARLREHAQRDHDQQEEVRRPRLLWVRAASIFRRACLTLAA